MTGEEALLKILCEINNRLTDIAITLQTIGWLNANREADEESRRFWLLKLSELSQAECKKYATFESVSV